MWNCPIRISAAAGKPTNLYQVLVTVDGRTLKIVLLKMQGYSTKEIAPLVHLTTAALRLRANRKR